MALRTKSANPLIAVTHWLRYPRLTDAQDVRYVAKDISLFSAVLKDLGRAFERGKHAKLYRSDIYDTSLLIVKECKGVFSEIEEILKKSSKDGSTIDKGISLDRAGKFMWLFRKSRVQLLRGNLESLKSTILVELAVLNYAEKVSSPVEYYSSVRSSA